jgi:SNF2 family DNA or RNA helicase
VPRLRVRSPGPADRAPTGLPAELSFDYARVEVPLGETRRNVLDAGSRRLIVRDPEAERAAADALVGLGVKVGVDPHEGRPVFHIPSRRWLPVVEGVLGAGWRLDADGAHYRMPARTTLEVRSGIDWFDLDGMVDFGGQVAALPALLAALAHGHSAVRLDDGSVGVLPAEWRTRHAALAALAGRHDGVLRFTRSQAAWLDVLLALQPEVRVDEAFARARDRLREFERITPVDPPGAFRGVLRDYQREGLGWLEFLERLGFGGCLADDMGLGKTVQVLAALAGRTSNEPRLPSLVVMPRTLVFNWKVEASRFAPDLRVVDYTGSGRHRTAIDQDEADLVITTYGTLRRDAARLAKVQFDYVILDEAHAIKNAATASAKATRLLQARHRLALTGTPVQNSLADLWSLFEFLNPGMLGTASEFAKDGVFGRNPDEESRRLLAAAVRPFVLRRTKAAVARELPARSEQTIYCDLDSDQRRAYDELRDHYRRSLLARVTDDTLGRAKIQVLEALLRLRQAACHPGLLDKAKAGEPSAKLEVLVSHLSEVVAEGHKVLVFSQFTSLLRIVRDRLDREGIVYEYLDGRTRDRQARVDRFQGDAACPVFLISLKAGGLGLNLTAAEYVFLLDPWWNPAIEAQAIDRSHRIGQTRAVFAYRLITRGTVEEKVLELQETKRGLATAIIEADANLLQTLTREDLERLLS